MVFYAIISPEYYVHIESMWRKYSIDETTFDSIRNGETTLERIYRVPIDKIKAEIESGLAEIVENTGILNGFALNRLVRKIKRMPKTKAEYIKNLFLCQKQ